MNENPEGTPNPLAQAPETAAPAPAPAPVAEAPAPAPAPVASEPVAPATPVAPVEAAPVEAAPKKKKKVGVIIGVILGIIALGCGIAAALIFFVFNKSGDPVTDAVVKLINGDNRNVAIAGTYEYEATGVPVSIGFSAQVDTVAKAGLVTADITGTTSGVNFTVNAEVRLPGDDKAYLKISGIKDIFTSALGQSGIDCETVDCSTYIEMLTNSMSSTGNSSLGVFGSLLSLDSKWILLDGVDLTSGISLPAGVGLDDISSRKNEIVDTYKKYPFLKSSTKDLKISKKNDTLYKIEIDNDKLASFVNEVTSKNGGTSSVSASDVQTAFSELGEIYVEIDGNNNFTRLYANGQDLSVTYPSNINIVTPDDYTTSDSLMEVFGQMFSGFSFGGSSITDCDSYSDNCIDYDYDYDDDDDDDDDDDSFDWIWDDDEE